MSPLGIFVLDVTKGEPASGIAVTISIDHGQAGYERLGRALTGADGCVKNLLPDGDALPTGNYRLVYETTDYFAAFGEAPSFPEIIIDFSISDDRRYVLPLLLAPHSYTFYRGS
jgi:5-hydroxyisourate hydrolase